MLCQISEDEVILYQTICLVSTIFDELMPFLIICCFRQFCENLCSFLIICYFRQILGKLMPFFRDMLLRPPMLALMLCDFANSWSGLILFTSFRTDLKYNFSFIYQGPLHPCDGGSNFLLGGSWLWYWGGELQLQKLEPKSNQKVA